MSKDNDKSDQVKVSKSVKVLKPEGIQEALETSLAPEVLAEMKEAFEKQRFDLIKNNIIRKRLPKRWPLFLYSFRH